MEIETLGPMVKLGPGESTTHIEHWYLFKGVEAGNAEKSLEAAIMPLVEKAVTK
jgi:hypothetical protein